MRKNVLIALLIVSSVCLADSVQQGCVKTRGRMVNGKHVPGQGLPGSIVSIKDRTAIGVKNNNGTFSFPVTDNQFRVDSVKKKDYVLLDADAASKTYTHTADTLFFVMETPEQILQNKLSTEHRLRRSLRTKLQARENELDSLITIQKISQEEYLQSLQKLYAEQSENEKFTTDMAERYSQLDYDQMNEFYRQVSYYIEECEFVKADSLLKTRGNLQAQIEAALQAGQYHQQSLTIRKQLLRESHLDVATSYDNIGNVYYSQGDYARALECYYQALAIRTQLYRDSHPDVAFSYNNIGMVYHSHGDYARALEYYQQSLTICEQIFGKEHPTTKNIQEKIEQTLQKLNEEK